MKHTDYLYYKLPAYTKYPPGKCMLIYATVDILILPFRFD